MNILFDLNIVIDYLVSFRESHRKARDIFDFVQNQKINIWLSASSMDNLQFILKGEAKRFELKWHNLKPAFDEFVRSIKIFSVTGTSIREAVNAGDMEDHIIYNNFKRIAPDGIVISNDTDIGNYPDVVTPHEFIEKHENLSKSKTIPMLDLKEEYRYMLEDIDNAVLKNIADTKYILGPEVKTLENKAAEYLGVKHCIGCSSGTDALVLSLRALAIKTKGKEYFDKTDEIITTPFTFTATGDAILRSGATPVFVDIDPQTYNIDHNKIMEYINSSKHNQQSAVRGIIPVHLYGQSCRMDEIMNIAGENNLFVVEDVAQAFGGEWNGSAGSPKKLGSMGITGCFSFFPSKNLGGFGDGGMVSTNDDDIAGLVRMLLKHGGKDKYNVDHIGYNARFDTLQAAIILAKFKHIDEFNERRRKIADIYTKELADLEHIITPSVLHDVYHVFHQYTIRVKNGKRDELQKYLTDKGISTMVYYPHPLHKMKVFDVRSYIGGNLEHAETSAGSVLSLPVEPLMKDVEIKYIVDTIREYCLSNFNENISVVSKLSPT